MEPLRFKLMAVASADRIPRPEIRHANPAPPHGPVTAALDAMTTLERLAEQTDRDPLDRAMVDALAGLSEVMRFEGENLRPLMEHGTDRRGDDGVILKGYLRCRHPW